MEGSINYPIQSLWIGRQLSKVEQLCIQSFIDHGHQFHLYTYEEVENVPKKTTVIDARTIVAENAIFSFADGFAKGSYAGFADLFRLLLIQKKGGWWVDMDVICLNPFDLQQELVICSSFEGEYGSQVNNCIFKAPPYSPFLTHCINEVYKTDIKNMGFGDAGPFLFQRVVKELCLEEEVVPYYYFNPIFWRYINDLVLGMMGPVGKIKEIVRPLLKPPTMPGRRIRRDSYAVHFWNEIWRAHGLDKNAVYSYSSLFEKLKRKHGIK